MRSKRQARWKDLVRRLWQDWPSVLYRWLKATHQYGVPYPSLRVQEVDEAVKGYGVERVWRMHAVAEVEESWAAFEHLPRLSRLLER